MAIHSAWMGVKTTEVYATGGASGNRAILQILADVNNADVYQFEVAASAALGAALRAYHGARKAEGRECPWPEITAGFAEPRADSRVSPSPEHVARYARLKEIYRACEAHALRGGPDPTPLLEQFAAQG